MAITLPFGPSDKDVEDTKAANPGVELYSSTESKLDIECLFRKPSEPEWKRFRELLLNPDSKSIAGKSLVYGCRLWPAKAILDELVKEWPGIIETFTAELIVVAGVSNAAVTKKL